MALRLERLIAGARLAGILAIAGCGARTGVELLGGAPDASDALADSLPLDAAFLGVRSVAVGALNACALLVNGTVDCWGAAAVGNASSPSWKDCAGGLCLTRPVPVPGLSEVAALAAGDTHTCALVSRGAGASGIVECWGEDEQGQLGDGARGLKRNCPFSIEPCSSTPVRVESLSGAAAIVAGTEHTCALVGDGSAAPAGTVLCWGDNLSGELGNGSNGPDECEGGPCSYEPIPVQNLSDVVSLAAGGAHTCALLSGRTVACWGDNSYGQLGVGAASGPDECQGLPCAKIPQPVPNLSGVMAIAAGEYHTCALLSDGSVSCWGRNDAGQLGLGEATGPESCGPDPCSTVPMPVPGLAEVVALAVGGFDSCAVLATGTVQCWGDDQTGQLGNGSTGPDLCSADANPPVPCATAPVQVVNLDGVVQLSAGTLSTCAVVAGAALDCWGDNASGELADNATTGPSVCDEQACSPTPVHVEF